MIKPLLSAALLTATLIYSVALPSPVMAQAQDVGQFSTFDAESRLKVDTNPYRDILGALTVTELGRTLVAYDAAHTQALPYFAQYTDYLSHIPVERLNRDEQLAYWLNTRNFLLVQALSEEGRVSRFRKERGTPSDPGAFWTEKRITVSGVSLSLQDIEQDILFKYWDNPNIIFGLYQGMAGGPTLPTEPFTAENVHSELEEKGSRFNSQRRNFRVRNEAVRISSYFDWYLPLAYGNDEAALRDHLSSFAKADQQNLVWSEVKLTRRKLSTNFEQFRPREVIQQQGTGAAPTTRGLGS